MVLNLYLNFKNLKNKEVYFYSVGEGLFIQGCMFMAEKLFKTRIKQRQDISANWESKNPMLLNGEVIIVDTINDETRTKTSNGTKTYTQLLF